MSCSMCQMKSETILAMNKANSEAHQEIDKLKEQVKQLEKMKGIKWSESGKRS